MIDRLFSQAYEWINKHRAASIIIIITILVASVYGLFLIPFNNDIDLMLPADGEFSKSLEFLRESNFSDKIILSLGLKSHDKDTQDIISAARFLKQRLKSPYVQQIDEGLFESNILDEMKGFLTYVPQITTDLELLNIKDKINAKEIEAQLKRSYNRMLAPGSIFSGYLLRNDPISIKLKYLKSVQNLMESIGYKAKVQQGHFISNDGKHVMLILSTPIRTTDSLGARKLFNYLYEQLEFLPSYISVDIVSGHLHTLSNEAVLKKDIAKTVVVVSIILLMLLILVFRNIRALVVFFVPIVAILISLNITSFFSIGKLSLFVVGMAAVIVGIAVDYGIHIYLAVQAGGIDKVKRIAKPIIVCALTTMGVFSSFLFSNIYGYKQFALVTNFSILISILFYLFMFPRFLEGRGPSHIKNKYRTSVPRIKMNDKVLVFAWLIIMVSMIIFAGRLEFSSDLRAYDGSSDAIFEAENRFHKTWGLEREPAIFVAESEHLEEALKINERISQEAKEVLGEDNFSSLAKVYPSMGTRRMNLSRWKSFWKGGAEDELRGLLDEYGKNLNFSEDAFDPFFNSLYKGSVSEASSKDTQLLDRVKKRFLQRVKSGYYIMSFFPDKEILFKKVLEISSRFKNTFVVSRNNMAKSISVSVYREVIKLAQIAVVLVVLLTFILLKNIRLTILALLPVVTSVCTILGMMAILGFSLSAPALIATLVVIGLCIDYGVFMVYECKYSLEAKTLLAISLSAITTIIGGGVLLLAKHPVLFYVGVAMTIGILSGYLVAVFIIPSCYRLWIPAKK